jgi:cytochrome c-type biogenesis protein CcmF
MTIHYIGEHLLPGLVGKTFVWIGFAAALMAMVLYFVRSLGGQPSKKVTRGMARSFFLLHAASLLVVAGILYFLIFRHYFEYSYVWQYSSKDLDIKYIISCFWAGQEGSFLVWAIWQALLGVVLIFVAREWEDRVLTVFSLSQVFVTSMMLGIQVFGWKIGGSPFALLRETYGGMKDTIFSDPGYLSQITDGNGLNPLLENIWMTIHPPVLFLGYALALVPFSYAMASLMKRDYISWIRPVIPWTVLSLFFLGGGILLGGAWAYVSLTFGGFWSWDPVENSSLVPWMILVAGLHLMLIARKQHFAMLSAYLMIGLSYVLVLYASFLTRSGILAETSAHSFGDNGMAGQLLVFLLFFLVLMLVLVILRVRQFHEKKKEILLSREFWMFIGSIVVVLAAFQILFTTSIPVVNRVFGTALAPPADSTGFYNRWQMPYALLIAGFIAFSQFLVYHENEGKGFFRKMAIPLVLSAAITALFVFPGIVRNTSFVLFLFFIIFSVVSSLYNLVFQTSRPRNTGAIITHSGFALFLLGVLLTFSNSRTISVNTSQFDLGDMKKNAENLMMVRNDTLYMSGYYVAYVDKKTVSGNLTEYRVDFLKRRSGKYIREFSLFPSVNRHPRMGDVYNPDTRHFLWKDYYMYISSVGSHPDYIVIKAIMNPYINILWAGSLIMTGGFAVALFRRLRKRQVSNT